MCKKTTCERTGRERSICPIRLTLVALVLGAAAWLAACDDVSDPLEPMQGLAGESAFAKGGPTPNGPNALPERGRIVFMMAASAAGHYDLYSAEEDGSDLIRLTYSEHDDLWPAVSRDGKKIAYVAEGADDHAEIVVMNIDGSNPRTLTSLGLYQTMWGVMEWSPNGKQLAIALNPDGDTKEWDLFVINAANGSATQITDFPGAELFPTWSPDGRWLAFSSKDANDVEQVSMMHPDGSELQAFTSCQTACSQPRWSPDGAVMVYKGGPAGSVVSQIADPSIGVNIGLLNAAWSPDGARLVGYDTDQNQYGALSTVSANGGPTTVIRNDPGLYAFASWARR